MFTGIVREQGVVRAVERRQDDLVLDIEARHAAEELERGDSVAVDGVCLTAARVRRRRFVAHVVPETVERTTLGRLRPGGRVNIELPVRLIDRMGGHLVQGHVDGTARVARVEIEPESRRLLVEPGPELLRYIVPKGSVALDGVSLTVAGLDGDSFEVALVPHTLRTTTLADARVGSLHNLEVDLIAKYVEALVEKE